MPEAGSIIHHQSIEHQSPIDPGSIINRFNRHSPSIPRSSSIFPGSTNHHSRNHLQSFPASSILVSSSLHTSPHPFQSISRPYLGRTGRKWAMTNEEIVILSQVVRLIWHENDRRQGKIRSASMLSKFPSREKAIAQFS